MAHKLDRHSQLIFDFKAQGLSVRAIAEKLTEASGERVSSSTVHNFLKVTNGESKESPQIVQAIPAGSADSIQVRLDELKAQLDRIELQQHWTDSTVRAVWHETWTFKWNNWLNRFLRGGLVLRGSMWVEYYPRKWWWKNDRP